MRSKWADGDARRRAVDRALAEGGVLDPLGGADGKDVENWLNAEAGDEQDSAVVTITLTSDDPEDLTLKQARLLGTCDTLLHDPAIPTSILDRSRADAQRIAMPADPPGTGLTVVLTRA